MTNDIEQQILNLNSWEGENYGRVESLQSILSEDIWAINLLWRLAGWGPGSSTPINPTFTLNIKAFISG